MARKRSKKPPKIGGRSRTLAPRLGDGRTKEGKAYAEAVEALHAWLGGEPDVAQQMLVQPTAILWMRCCLLAETMIDPDTLDSDKHSFLALQSNLRRNLESLGLKPMQAPAMSPRLLVGLGAESAEGALERLEKELQGIHDRLAQAGEIPDLTDDQAATAAELVRRGLAGDSAAWDAAREIFGDAAKGKSDASLAASVLTYRPGEAGAEHPDSPTVGEREAVTDVEPINDAEAAEPEAPVDGHEKPAGPGVVERIRRVFLTGEGDKPKAKPEPSISRSTERRPPVSSGATSWDGRSSLGDFVRGQD